MASEDHGYYRLVEYHKVRRLSLNDCVQRFKDLLPEIVRYFEGEAHNTSIRPGERSKMQEFHDELVHPEFHLYLLFLSGALPRLASINAQLQKSDLDLFTAYLKINWFFKVYLFFAMLSTVYKKKNIRIDISDIDYDITEFQQCREQSIASGQLSCSRLQVVMKI